jgi:hypothetical protein
MYNIQYHYEKKDKQIGKIKYADLKFLWSVNKRTVRNETVITNCYSNYVVANITRRDGVGVGGHIQILNLEAPFVSCNLRGVCREDITALASLLKLVQGI